MAPYDDAVRASKGFLISISWLERQPLRSTLRSQRSPTRTSELGQEINSSSHSCKQGTVDSTEAAGLDTNMHSAEPLWRMLSEAMDAYAFRP